MNLIQSFQNILQKISFGIVDDEKGLILPEKITEKPLQFEKIYQNKSPLVMEFGVGKGRFMRDYATKYPNKNFFGVEKVNKWIKHSAERFEKAQLKNARLVNTDANKILAQTPEKSISEYYILFPDPWPKRRHQPRRIIQTNLIQQIHETLVDQGKLYIVTDHESYFQWMKKIVTPFLNTQFKPVENEKVEFVSNYQIKYEREGRPIYSIYLQKI